MVCFAGEPWPLPREQQQETPLAFAFRKRTELEKTIKRFTFEAKKDSIREIETFIIQYLKDHMKESFDSRPTAIEARLNKAYKDLSEVLDDRSKLMLDVEYYAMSWVGVVRKPALNLELAETAKAFGDFELFQYPIKDDDDVDDVDGQV